MILMCFSTIGTIKVRDQKKTIDTVIKLKKFLELLVEEECPYYWKDEDNLPEKWDDFLVELLPEEFTFCGPFDLSK